MRRALLRWYDEHRRDLPWRRDRDPYRVWVSEVMLQQTRVETVVPYYERWLARFPDVLALADAPDDEVLGAWAGLGYYRRARALHQASRVVRDRHGARVPEDLEALRALPGVGPYTAGAIASIAFGRAAPAVDANARRVLTRLFDLDRPRPADLERVAGALVSPRRPGDFNQALMELGARVCAPRSPACGACPVARWCLARARGTIPQRPERRSRARVPAYRVGTAVVVRRGRVLLARRPTEGLLGGMWEFPGAIAGRGESPERAARRVALALLGDRAALPARAPRLAVIDHAYSHRRHVYHAHRFEARAARIDRAGRVTALPSVRGLPCVRGAADWTDVAWREITELDALPMGAAQRRIARAVAKAP